MAETNPDGSNECVPPARILDALEGLSARISLLEGRVASLQDAATVLLQRQTVALDDGFLGVRTPLGWIVLGQEEFRSALYLAAGNFGHEPGTTSVIRRWLDLGDKAVDVGSHIGLMTLPMVEAVGASGFVYAFEPNPRSAEAARRSLVANGFSERASITVSAVADRVKSAPFYRGYNSMMGSLHVMESEADFTTVETTSLDRAIKPGTVISLVKVDVEGAEIDVLAGMRRVLGDSDDICVIAEFGNSHLRRAGISVEDWLGRFKDSGLPEVYAIGEFSPDPRPVDASDLETVTSVNLLFTKAGSSRLQRLSKPDWLS